jgi:hypothetical protein
MKLSRTLLAGVAAVLGGGCSGDSDPGRFVGNWRGAAGDVGLALEVGNESAAGGTVHLQGTISTGRLVCLNKGPMAGTVTNNTVQLSGHGSGTRSSLTLFDVVGELKDDTISGTLTLKGDSTNEEMCVLDKVPVSFQKVK